MISIGKERILIELKELGIELCNAGTKRKIKNPVWDKLYLESVSIFYKMGYIFRDKNNPKKYYSAEEVEEKVKALLLVNCN